MLQRVFSTYDDVAEGLRCGVRARVGTHSKSVETNRVWTNADRLTTDQKRGWGEEDIGQGNEEGGIMCCEGSSPYCCEGSSPYWSHWVRSPDKGAIP